MKRTLSITLAVLTIGLLGSCSKINERLDNLEKKVDGIENEQIASINSQIDGIKTSIADLGTIRSDISSLKQSASDHSVDIFNLEEADRALKDRIVNLEDYVDAVLPNYAEKEWVEATFSTLEQYEATCDTIAKIDARIGALDAKLSKDIKACADSLTKWVNKTFEGYYTAAQMDAKVTQMKSDIDSAKAANKITDAKADSIAGELAKVKPEVDTVKANIRAEYKAAVKAAIEESEGKLTKEITDKIATANTAITNLTTRVTNLENEVDELTGRVEKLEGMIQSVTIVPAYSDGSVDAKAGFVTVNIIVEPASAVAALDKSCITVFVNTVKTKSVSLDTAEVVTLEKDTETGIVSILADVSDFTPESGNALAVAVNVKTGLSDYTTDFSPVTSTNVKVVVGGEGEPNQVLMTAKDPDTPKDVEGKIPVKSEDGKNTFDQSKSTVIKVVGIGTVTFDETAAATINTNAAGADSIFFEVKDVTPGGKQEVVYQVLMKKATDQGEEVFSVSNAAGEVTMEIPLGSDVADVTKVTLLDEEGKPIDGGVVYGSVIYDSVNKIVTFKVNHFSKYAVGYILDDENYHKVTGISLDKSALELEKGTFKKLIATIKPDNASNKNVIWSSSDTSKVKVDTAGKVTAVAEGKATITATSMNDRSKTATCTVTVVKEVKTMAEILKTATGIPESKDLTPPANAWVNSTDPDCKAFIGIDAEGDTLFVIKKGELSNPPAVCMNDEFEKIDDNTYKRTEPDFTFTVKMTEGKFTSLEFNTNVEEIKFLNGTYSAPVSSPTFKAVYNTNGGANTLTFYYDANDHSREGTVYEDGTDKFLFNDTNTYGAKWGYNEKRGEIKSVVIDASVADYKGLTSTTFMFQGMTTATNISGAEYLDVLNVTDMSYMFQNFGGGKSGSPTTLNVVPDVSQWNTGNVKNMLAMFESYGNFSSSLDKVPDVSGWNTGMVTDMTFMFQKYGHESQNFNAVPDVSQWNTGYVTNMKQMFYEYGHKSTALNTVPNVSGWNTGNVTNMSGMFNGYGYTSTNISCVLDLSGWDLSKITEKNGDNVFNFNPSTFKVTIPAKTGEKSNEGGKWYYGNEGKSIAPPTGKTFTLPLAGALAGEFSVSATKKVHFSKGNLYWDGDSFEFEANQYDFQNSWSTSHVSHFYWSKTASVTYAQSYSESGTSGSDVFFTNAETETAKSDFTVNGVTGKYRTLSAEEWTYILSTRANATDLLVENVTVCGVEHCLVIAPDACLNSYEFDKTKKSYDAAAWATAEAAGLVCLPPAGYRDGTDVKSGEGNGFYWASTTDAADKASNLGFKKSDN